MNAPPAPGNLPERRTQAQRRAASEDRLLAAAADIIAAEGYLACTLERVGTSAGFSRGLASRKYGSKDGLIEAVIWRVSAHVHDQIDSAVAGIADPVDRLITLVDRFITLVQQDSSVRAYFVLFSAMIANRLETRDIFQQVQERFGTRLRDMIVAANKAREVPLDPDSTAFLLGSLLQGLAIELTMSAEVQTAAPRTDLARIMRAVFHNG